MKQITSLFVLTGFVINSFGQDKKDLAISLAGGVFSSPYFEKANAKEFYTIGFDYYLSKKHILAVTYLSGRHRYFDNIQSNTPGFIYDKGTNAIALYRTFSVSYKYKIVDHSKISIVPSVGAGFMTHIRKFPFAAGNYILPYTSAWTDLVFPVDLDINYKISKHWQLGITGGFQVHPDFPILGWHIGPGLSYIIK